jgi:hypothetical protein
LNLAARSYVYYPSLVEPVSLAGEKTRQVPVFQAEAYTLVPKPGAYYYEQVARPILPTGNSAPATVYVPSFAVDYPFHFLQPRLSGAILSATAGSSYKGLASIVTPPFFPISDLTVWPNRYPAQTARDLAAMGQVANILPATIPPFISAVSSYDQPVFPQWHGPTNRSAVESTIGFTGPVLPQPQAPATVIMGWLLGETYQNYNPARYDWITVYQQVVGNILPIPFIPPPPGPCTGSIFGTDPNISMNLFGGNAHPYAVLYCRICQSGKPLLVRADQAIWCQDCCKFVPIEQTYQNTTRGPLKFRSVI